jgi:hypothetical protein
MVKLKKKMVSSSTIGHQTEAKKIASSCASAVSSPVHIVFAFLIALLRDFLIFTLLFDIFCKLHRASIRPVFQFIVDAVKKNFDSSSAATLQDLLPSINQFSRLRDVIKGAPEPCNRTACASFGLRL